MSMWRMVLFFALASLFCYSTLFPPDKISWMLKVAPIVVLAITAFQHASDKVGYLFVLGLIASGCGDFLLHYDREHWFIFGLAAFFVAHSFYLLALMPFKRKFPRMSLLYVVLGAGMIFLFWPNLSTLKIPVIGYVTILLFMATATIWSKRANAWLMIGGALFVISDAMIGLDKFYQPIPHGHFAIMVTYYLAQFSLFMGIFRQQRHEHRRIFS